MGEVKWTKEQSQAIYEKGNNILVAAGAGSGKTAVLVERIINKIINEKIDINKLLVVTFTNAAASEMRERVLDAIYKKLDEDSENTHLQRQITLLNKASICTIDSFCLEVVKNNFYQLDNISPNFRIADNTEIEILKEETLEELFDKKYEEENEDFLKLINTYTSYKDDSPLKDLILKIFTYIGSNPFPEKWLKEKIELFNLSEDLEKDFSNTIWGKELLNELEEEVIDDITALEGIEESLSFDTELDSYQKIVRNDIDMLVKLKNHLDNWEDAYNISKETNFVQWRGKKVESEIKDEAKKVRDDVRDKFKKLKGKIMVSDSKQSNIDILDMYHILVKLENLILEFSNNFAKKKREKNIVDFTDIEHFALKILLKENEDGKIEPSDIAKKYQEKFEEIAIDEYQDSNLVQEYILTSISRGNNIFMVGDVKQSIYKFRQAMPELFLNKYQTYKEKEKQNDGDNLKIKLFKNFRSRENVLDFTNVIFQNIMSSLLGDIEYNEDEYLNLGASYKDSNQNLNTEIDIINIKKDEDEDDNDKYIYSKETDDDEDNEEETEEKEPQRIEDLEVEAKYVARKIKELVDSKFQVWDKKLEDFRPIKYRDIVVLLRATSVASPVFEQEILSLDIPVFSDMSQEYLDSIEITTIMNLLKIIDNPMQDIPLVTVLRSNIGKFTDDDLIRIRLSDKQANFYTCLQKAIIDVEESLSNKIKRFLDNLDKWRKEQEYLSLDEFIWKIYLDTGYYNYVGLMPNGELRQANLKMLFQKAKQYESANFKGLYNFINFIDKIKLSSRRFRFCKTNRRK